MEPTSTITGQELRRIRKACGVSVANFARAVKRNPWTIKQWEKGTYPIPPWAEPFVIKMKRATRAHYDPRADIEKYAHVRPIF